MIPNITVLPYECTPILGTQKDKSSSTSGAALDAARALNGGAALILDGKRDSAQLKQPPIIVSAEPASMDKYYLTSNKQFAEIFRNMALGTEKDNMYKAYFAQETASLLGNYDDQYGVAEQLEKLIGEIRTNFEAGVTDPMANLQTKFTFDGVTFSFDEMLAAKGTIEYAHNILGSKGTADRHRVC